MGESRTELLAWLNDLLALNYTKVEQAGTGAAYCQIMDSIYGDVKLNKVKFDTKAEYEYVANFKVLQYSFDKHKVDKIIPVERLVKCKFQDNLEFMQWVKRFWDQNYPGGAYDAQGRRKGGVPTARQPRSNAPSRAGLQRTAAAVGGAPRIKSTTPSVNAVASDSQSTSMIIDLNKQIAELKLTVDGLEKERDFYFGKLRDVEIIVQGVLEDMDEGDENHHSGMEPGVLKDIQAILYSTEEGFEVPPEDEVEQHVDDYDDETF